MTLPPAQRRLPNVIVSHPEVFDDCSSVLGKLSLSSLSLRGRAINREVNETACAQNFLETGGTVDSKSRERIGYCILSARRRLHFVISDFGPPSVTESSEEALEPCHWKLFVDF